MGLVTTAIGLKRRRLVSNLRRSLLQLTRSLLNSRSSSSSNTSSVSILRTVSCTLGMQIDKVSNLARLSVERRFILQEIASQSIASSVCVLGVQDQGCPWLIRTTELLRLAKIGKALDKEEKVPPQQKDGHTRGHQKRNRQ
jgi:hypothetical protein